MDTEDINLHLLTQRDAFRKRLAELVKAVNEVQYTARVHSHWTVRVNRVKYQKLIDTKERVKLTDD